MYLVAFAFPVFFAVAGWLSLRSLNRWLDDAVAEYRRHRDYGVGEPAPGSIDATLEEIASLPEVDAA